MAFRYAPAVFVIVGNPGGRQVIIDPNQSGQIQFFPDPTVTNDGPAGIGIDTTPAVRLRMFGPQKAGFTAGQITIEEANAIRISDAGDSPLVELDVGNGFLHPVQYITQADNVLVAVPGFMGIPAGQPVYMQRGTFVGTTDGASNISLNFGTAFPNALDCIVTGCVEAGSSNIYMLVLTAKAAANASFNVRTTGGVGVGAAFTTVFEWIAVGH